MRSPSATPAPPSTIERTISRTEWLWLLGAVLFGAILRLSFPGRMAIEHFDEGVYASNFWFEVEQGGEYPARHLYAPPLLPLAIEWTMIVASLCGIKPTGFIPMIPSLIAGLVTIPSLWWVGRRWFGPSAGIVAAWLVAASDFHASYSRAALTDVPVCLFMLWGVYFMWQALQSGTRRDILLAGLFTGLAWWTKYNGWLPLAIGLSGGAAWQLSLPRADRRLRQFFTRWLLVALTAFVIWSPVLWGLQKHGGYAAVAANHRQYVGNLDDFERWCDTALSQMRTIGAYDNWFGALHEAFGEIRDHQLRAQQESTHEHDEIDQPNGAATEISRIDTLAAKLSLLATPLILLALTAIASALSLVRDRRSIHRLGGWLLSAWFGGLTLVTPLYYPYPRLVIPWLIASWLGVGLALHLWRERAAHVATIDPAWKPNKIELVLMVWLVTCCGVRGMIGASHVWDDRAELSELSNRFANKITQTALDSGHPPDEVIVYVYGAPAIFFGLKSNGLVLVAPVQDLGFLVKPHPRHTFLVVGPRAFRSLAFDPLWASKESPLENVVKVNMSLSHLVCFDEIHNPHQPHRTTASYWLERVIP